MAHKTYRELLAWQKAVDLAEEIYTATKRSEERTKALPPI